MKKERKKPAYNLWQNSAYMIGKAWGTYRSVLFFGLALTIVMILSNLAQLFIAPVILKKVENAVPLAELLWIIAGFSGVIIILSGLSAYINQNTLFGRVALRGRINEEIAYKQMTTSYPNTEDIAVLKKLEKAQRTTSSNSEAAEGVWNTLFSLLRNLAGFLIYLLLLSGLDPVLMVIVVATSAIGYFAGNYINGWGYRHRDEEAECTKRMRYINNSAKNIPLAKDIRIFGMRPWLEEVYGSARRMYEDFIARRERVCLWADIIDVALNILRSGAAYAYLIALTLREGLPASQFLLYFTAVGGFSSWVTGILSGFSNLHRQSLDLSAMREYMELPESFRFEDGEPLKAVVGQDYELRFEDVSFRYPEAEKDTIRHLNLTIHPGEKLAIVGLNGAGKTTLVKLLCGFYDPTEGRVLLNGEDIRKYNRRDYYSLFSAVFQQFSVLEATVAENVSQRYLDEGTADIDMQRVWDCLEQAGLREKIMSLPGKELANIGRKVFEDGVEFSGGQMQRLMLARMLYKNAPIIILDEPTAALDPIAENDIYQKYNELTAGRTSVFISHRLASTRFCDRILFMEQGQVAEEGSHEVLLSAGGKYADLFAVQSKYYQEGSDPSGQEEIER